MDQWMHRKTIKQMLYKHQSIHSWANWLSILPKLTENYNKSYHQSIKCSPLEAVKLPQKVLLERLRDASDFRTDEPEETLKVGDTVRLRLIPESKLDKARQYYSNETYTITKIFKGNENKLTSYKIRNNRMEMKGTYNYTDLLPVDTIQEPPKGKPKEARIKRIGMQRQAEIDDLERGRNLRPKPVRNNEYVVEKILDTRIQNHRIEYLVKWSGYEKKHSTWQNEEDLVNARGKIQDFLRKKNLVYILV